MEKIYDCEEVAARYGCNRDVVRRWIREKKLSAIKVGKGYRVRESDLEKFERDRATM